MYSSLEHDVRKDVSQLFVGYFDLGYRSNKYDVLHSSSIL